MDTLPLHHTRGGGRMFRPSGITPAAGALSRKFEAPARVLDERTRHLVAAAEAFALGHGGVTLVAEASGLSRGTVMRGIAELITAPNPASGPPRPGEGPRKSPSAEEHRHRPMK